MSVYGELAGVATCAKVVQPVPVQRSSWYPVTPTLSVADKVIVTVVTVVPVITTVGTLGADESTSVVAETAEV